MADMITITANWATGSLSESTISRQYDNNRYRIQFVGYPEDGAENLKFYLLVWMRTERGGQGTELAPIELDCDQWNITNYFTQIVQQIRFQLCVQNEAGTFEAHSPIFTASIADSLEHTGREQDINVDGLFDRYKEYVEDLVVNADAMIIDGELDENSRNPVQNRVLAGALKTLNEYLMTDAEAGALAAMIGGN